MRHCSDNLFTINCYNTIIKNSCVFFSNALIFLTLDIIDTYCLSKFLRSN